MRILYFVLMLIIIILGITFASMNSSYVSFDYYFGKLNISLSLLLVYTLIIGVALGMLVLTGSLLRLKRKNHQLKKQLKQAEQEIENIRSLPMRDHN